MGGQLVIRPRRRRTRQPVWLDASPAAALATGGTEWLPRLGLAEPEDPGRRRASAAVSVGLHAAILSFLIGLAWLAPPELVEKIIPVVILQPRGVELPGTNAEPAPAAPKAVGVRRTASAAALAAAQNLTADQAEALRRAALDAARRALEQMQLESVAKPQLPAQVERREVEATRVAARAAASVLPRAALDASALEPVRIDPARLEALAPDFEAPEILDAPSVPDLSAAEALAILESSPGSDYGGGVQAAVLAPGALAAGLEAGAGGLEPGVAGASGPGTGGGEGGMGIGAGSGGTGHELGVVRCLESAHVQRYLAMVQSRTQQRWVIPAGIDPDARVVLRFGLDAAGMAFGVQAVDVGDPTLGQSAMRALQTSAPFPPMNDANRCLAEKRILLTFTVPRT